jgi:hypothetical protein
MFPNVYADMGETILFAAGEATGIYRELLGLAPATKLLFSTDASLVPELYWLGARVGRYSGTVDEQLVPYPMPQENGNKTDVRWVAVTDDRGVGLLAVGRSPLNVSAHRFTTDDLTRARHTYELARRPFVVLHLDDRQAGLGSASCGPGVLPQCRIQAQEMSFAVRLVALQGSLPGGVLYFR